MIYAINLSAIIIYHSHPPAHHVGHADHKSVLPFSPGRFKIANHNNTEHQDHYCQQILYPDYIIMELCN